MDNIRSSHVTSNNRRNKAIKIEKIISKNRAFNTNDKILEVGTGSGGIAAYFSQHSAQFIVDSVDIVDHREFKGDYNFQLIENTNLPFNSNSFDFVITNHVIEHVGEYSEQMNHLKEIHRVLKENGIVYLAVPNRWMIIEPHYQLIFLSWLPKRYRSKYLKKFRNVDFYDCEPLEIREIENMFDISGFNFKNQCFKALRLFIKDEREKYKFLYYIYLFTPNFILKIFLRFMPTLIYTLERKY